jgi:hypothetical protein
MAYKIGVAIKGTDTVKTVCPGEYETEIQAKAEIMKRNAGFPLAPRLERVVLIDGGN